MPETQTSPRTEQGLDVAKPAADTAPSNTWADAARREVALVGYAGAGAVDAAVHAFTDELPKTVIDGSAAAVVGGLMGRLSAQSVFSTVLKRAGAVGFAASLAMDILPRLDSTAGAFSDAWKSGENFAADASMVRANLGSLAFDTAWMTATGSLGGLVGQGLRPTRMLDQLTPSSVDALPHQGPRFSRPIESSLLRPDGFLKDGIHDMTWEQFSATYGTNPERQRLLTGMLDGFHDIRALGPTEAVVGGSFVTTKEIPNDFDAIINVPKGRFPEYVKMLPILSDRYLMKDVYGGEFIGNGENNKILNLLRHNTKGGTKLEVGVARLSFADLPPRPFFKNQAERAALKQSSSIPPGDDWTPVFEI